MFLIPPLACIALLAATWWVEPWPGLAFVAVIVAVAVVTQWLAPVFSPLWVAALILNVVCAVFLAVRMKVG